MIARMKVFADEWLTGAETGKQFHGLAAYKHAGYTISESQPYANASKLLRHPEVQEYIKKRMDEFAMSAEEALLRFTAIARSEVGSVVKKGPTGALIIDSDAVLENKAFISKFGFDSNGYPKIEFHDALQALRDIARVRGMMKDGLELTGAGGAAVLQVQFVDPAGETFHPAGEPTEDVIDPEDFSEFED